MANTLKSAYMAEKKQLQDKINDLELKLTNRIKEVKSLEQKIHMLCQSENSQKNELNFWNGKVSTLRRDLEYQQTFAENIQMENRKLQADVDNLNRLYGLREKDLALAKKEVAGLQEDNDRLNRMYLLMQKEAFHGVDKLKKLNGPEAVNYSEQVREVVKKGYQPLRAENTPGALGPDPTNKRTQNMWQIVDDGFGSSKDFSNITGYNGVSVDGGQ